MIIRTAPKDVSVSLLEKRRTQAIELQKNRRRELLQQLREIDKSPDITDSYEGAMEEEENNENEVVAMAHEVESNENEVAAMAQSKMDEDETEEERVRRGKREKNRHQKKNRALKYANLLMIPEWLIETPTDLGEEWTVMARPEGKRCLVRSSSRKTVCRGKHGGVLFYFNSNLPSGSPDQQKSGDAILDCIWHTKSGTFFILDVIRWNDDQIGQKPWEFRSTWRETMFANLKLGEISSKNKFKFRVLPCLQSNGHNLRKAYNAKSYDIDGLLFYHLKGEYCSGPSPLVHIWKDSKCSKWHINSTDGKTPNKHQCCALELKGSKKKRWWLESREGLVVAKLRANINLSFKSRAKKIVTPEEGSILKWMIGGLDLKTHTVKIWSYIGIAGNRRKADLFSKIAFQYQARSGSCVSFEALEKATKSEFVNRMSGMNDLLIAL